MVRIIGQKANIKQDEHSWKILGADHYRRREVHLGRKIVGEWRKSSESYGGEVFIIHDEIINEQAIKLGLDINGTDTKAEFEQHISK